VELSVIHGLEQGNEVLKEIHKEMNIEKVEKLLEESQEARDYQKVCPLKFTFCSLQYFTRRKSEKCYQITSLSMRRMMFRLSCVNCKPILSASSYTSQQTYTDFTIATGV
jgi:Snf7